MSPLAAAPSLFDELFGAPAQRAGEVVLGPAGEPDGLLGGKGHAGAVQAAGERTLDDFIVGAWEALSGHLKAACPICEEEMVPLLGAHSAPLGGRCRSCGTELS